MYSSGYSAVSKSGQHAQKKYRSKGKSCGYYMRIVFFFSSLIQSLIIVSLVLFLIYGKKEESPSKTGMHNMEKAYSQLSFETVGLRTLKKNLTNMLNSTLTEKARNDWDLKRCRFISNVSASIIQDLDGKLQKTNFDLDACLIKIRFPPACQPSLFNTQHSGGCNCALQTQHLKANIEFLTSNFTQTTQRMRMDLERISRERDNLNLEAIALRRERSRHEKELQFSKLKCKEDFVNSLSGVSNVSRAFLLKIESLFPVLMPFHITCHKQREHLERICSNCTRLSREVEDKFQQYLNNVGDRVSKIQQENSHLKAENSLLSLDYRWCSQNRTGMIHEHQKNLEKVQLKYDLEKEELLLEKRRLNGEKEVLENSVKFKTTEVQHLKAQVNLLNSTCRSSGIFGGRQVSSNPWNNSPGLGQDSRSGSTNYGSNLNFGSTGLNRQGSTGLGSSNFGSTGSGLNRQGSTGLGSSSLGSTGSGSNFGSTGSGLNRQGSTGLGSSSLGSTGSGSNFGSTGFGLNRQGSTGLGSSSLGSTGSGSNFGSTGSGLNRQGSTGLGSSSLGSTGSGSNFGSTGSGLNRQGSTGLGSSSLGSTGFGSNFGSTGLNKQGSTGLGSSSLGSTGFGSNFGSTGSGLNKQGSTGFGSSSLGVNKQGSTVLGSGSSSAGGTGLNKQANNGKASSSYGSSGSSTSQGTSGTDSSKDTSNSKSSGGSTSSTSKSSAFSWFGIKSSSSNSGQSKSNSGSGNGKASSGSGSDIAQHLRDLQRIINPSAPQEKQELSHMLG